MGLLVDPGFDKYGAKKYDKVWNYIIIYETELFWVCFDECVAYIIRKIIWILESSREESWFYDKKKIKSFVYFFVF